MLCRQKHVMKTRGQPPPKINAQCGPPNPSASTASDSNKGRGPLNGGRPPRRQEARRRQMPRSTADFAAPQTSYLNLMQKPSRCLPEHGRPPRCHAERTIPSFPIVRSPLFFADPDPSLRNTRFFFVRFNSPKTSVFAAGRARAGPLPAVPRQSFFDIFGLILSAVVCYW